MLTPMLVQNRGVCTCDKTSHNLSACEQQTEVLLMFNKQHGGFVTNTLMLRKCVSATQTNKNFSCVKLKNTSVLSNVRTVSICNLPEQFLADDPLLT